MIELLIVALTGFFVGAAPSHSYEFSASTTSASQFSLPAASQNAGKPILVDPHDKPRDTVKMMWLQADLTSIHPVIRGVTLLSPDRQRCVIVVPSIKQDGDPVYVFGHEALHCFVSRYHEGEPGKFAESPDQADIARDYLVNSVLPKVVTPEKVAEVRTFLAGK